MLVDVVGRILLDFNCEDGQYPQTDGEGYALDGQDPSAAFDLNDPVSWKAGTGIGCTPGSKTLSNSL